MMFTIQERKDIKQLNRRKHLFGKKNISLRYIHCIYTNIWFGAYSGQFFWSTQRLKRTEHSQFRLFFAQSRGKQGTMVTLCWRSYRRTLQLSLQIYLFGTAYISAYSHYSLLSVCTQTSCLKKNWRKLSETYALLPVQELSIGKLAPT